MGPLHAACFGTLALVGAADAGIRMTRTVGEVAPQSAQVLGSGHGVAKGVMRAARGGGSVPLTMLDVLTYCEVAVGSRRTPLKVIVDTGSSTLAVPSNLCEAGKCVARCDTCFYDTELSATFERIPCESSFCKASVPTCAGEESCHFTVQYTDRSGETGDLLRDSVGLGGFAVGAMTFGAIRAISPPNEFSRLQVDGILGLGGKRLNYNIPTVVDEVVAAYNLPNVFAMAVGEQGVPDSGVLDIGTIDHAQYVTPLEWTPMTWDTWYAVKPVALAVGGEYVTENEYDFGYMTIVDSGTTFTFLPYKIYAQVKNMFREKYAHLPYVTSPSGGDDGTIFQQGLCYSNLPLEDFPVLHFRFEGGAAVSVPPHNYFTEAKEGRTTYHCFGIAPSGGQGEWTVPMTQTILGDTFMAAAYVVFNRANSSMGFAQRRAIPPAPPLPVQHNAANDIGTVLFIFLCIALCVFMANRLPPPARPDDRGAPPTATTPLLTSTNINRALKPTLSSGPKRTASKGRATVVVPDTV